MADFVLYEEQFSEEFDYPPFSGEPRFLVIASTGRSGSHMLGHLLHQTGAFGFPLEYFNPHNLNEWERRLGVVGARAVLDGLVRRRTSPNGVFGIKLMYHHIENWGGPAILKRFFPGAVYILLRRRDVVAQAVSYARAAQTGVWIGPQKQMGTETYDFGQIDNCLRRIVKDTAAWEYCLKAGGSDPLEMTYEDIVADHRGAITSIASRLDIAAATIRMPDTPVTAVLRNATNAAWISRFRAEYENTSLFPQTSSARRLTQRVRRLIRWRG